MQPADLYIKAQYGGPGALWDSPGALWEIRYFKISNTYFKTVINLRHMYFKLRLHLHRLI